LTATATLRFNNSSNKSLRGLATGLFILSAANPASPFSNSVGLAVYGNPLRSTDTHHSAEANLTLDGRWGRWQGNLHIRHIESRDRSKFDEQTAPAAVALADGINPFASSLSGLIGIETGQTSMRSLTSLADLTLNGPVAKLPAGDTRATIEVRFGGSKLRSTSNFSDISKNRFHRAEQSVRGAFELPLTSRENNFVPQMGTLDATFEYSRTHYSDAGAFNHYSYGFNWEPLPLLRLHGVVNETSVPATIEALAAPVSNLQDSRVFDPLIGQTVDVTVITGGNAALRPQKSKIRNLSALVKLVRKLNLDLNGEYADVDLTNFVSPLPPASIAVMLAFPERFVRNSEGILNSVDLRPVNFASHREKTVRWGFSMNTQIPFADVQAVTTGEGEGARRSTYIQVTTNHTMILQDRVLIHPGLPPVDLLQGGAIGLGSGRVRHQIDGTAAITSGGLGFRAGLTWRGATTLQSETDGMKDTLHFHPLLLINVRVFAGGSQVFPAERWAKGFRVSLDVLNVGDSRQRVIDSRGSTPLLYAPAYRDPLGRTVEIEVRKIF
jgi:hypothetical protein